MHLLLSLCYFFEFLVLLLEISTLFLRLQRVIDLTQIILLNILNFYSFFYFLVMSRQINVITVQTLISKYTTKAVRQSQWTTVKTLSELAEDVEKTSTSPLSDLRHTLSLKRKIPSDSSPPQPQPQPHHHTHRLSPQSPHQYQPRKVNSRSRSHY